MSVEEKYTELIEKIPSVYDSGLDDGYENGYDEGIEQGKQAVFKRIQKQGQERNYYYAFAYDRFDDTNYFPEDAIKCLSGTTPARYIFYNATGLTDTKVEIIANSNNIDYAFYDAGFVTIRKLTVYETTKFNNTFYGLDDLENITFGGTIGQDISFPNSSKLTDVSIDSIIDHLKDLTGATSKTITFHSTVYDKMVASGKDALVSAKNWALVKG